jgi:hypothetical protein
MSPSELLKGEKVLYHCQSHLRLFGSLKDYLFFKDNVYACLNLSLTMDVDLEFL